MTLGHDIANLAVSNILGPLHLCTLLHLFTPLRLVLAA